MRVANFKIRSVLVFVTLLGMIGATIGIASTRQAAAFPGANGKIAFAQDGEIWTMNADGTGQALLRAQGLAPAWSADGQKIAFSDTSTANFEIWTMNADGSGVSIVTSGASDFDPAWSPDGAWITFRRRVALTNPSVPGATATATHATTLTDTVTASPFDNVRIGDTLNNTTTGNSGVVASKTATTLETVAPIVGGWTIDDAYTVTTDADRVYKVKADGTGLVALSSAGLTAYYDDYTPSWSPDGASIAYSTDRNGNDDIYIMGAGGESGGTTNLTADFLDVSWDPDWSPSGTQIVFSSAVTGTGGSSPENIWTMNADGTNKVILTDVGTVKDEAPTWSPDGVSIAFERTNAALDEAIFVVPAAGGTATALTANSPKKDSRPDWRPVLAGVADGYVVDEGAALVVPATGILGNDALLATAVGTATAVKDTDPANGSLTLNADGSFTYTHDGSETTTDSFTYHPVQDGVVGSVATVTITINPINDAPTAVDDGPYAVAFGGTVSKSAPGVLANDSDPEGGGLTTVLVSDVSNGTLTLNPAGSFSYTHDGSTTTTDSFTYRAKDSGGVTSNVATVTFTIAAEVKPIHKTGLVDPGSGKWYLYDDAGGLETSFFFGNPGDYPFMGDWDGDGVETPGLYRQSDGFVYLKNTNTQGIADISFFFGNPGDVPIAGDFNGDGFDTVSIYRPSNQRFFIINKLGTDGGGLGAADLFYTFGNPGDKPFVGDFNGDGIETAGLHRESTGLVYYRNTHTFGNADNQFLFGDPGDRLVAGDWTGDGVFTPALFRPSNTTMYFRYTNSQGNADKQWTAGQSAWLPVSGTR